MRVLAAFALGLTLLVACSPREAAEPTATPTPTAAPTVTATPVAPASTATATPTRTATPTSTPSPTPAPPPRLQFDIDESVPATERGLIAIGIEAADRWAEAEFGGAVRRTVFIQVATDGVCIGGASAIGYQICFNAGSESWLNLEPDYRKVKIAAHEYFHVWQHDLFCYRQPKWLFEGLAEWFGYGAIIEAGVLESVAASAERQELLQGAPIREPLSAQEILYAAPQPNQYALWSFAAERLMVRHDAAALRTFCAGNAMEMTWQDSFAAAFGQPVEDFYADFEAWRAEFLPYSAPED